MQYPWGYGLPLSHIISTCESDLSTHEGMQYPWVISSVPVSHVLSTCESYPRYPWAIFSVPVSHILSTRESYPQYPWVISSVPVRICSTHESYWTVLNKLREIKWPKLVTKYQNDLKAKFTGSPSQTELDSDSAEETEGEDKVSASSVISSSNSS